MAELKIAEVIFRERRKLKLTQEDLASALSVSSQAVSNWERGGYPDITLLPRIANFFKITVDELIGNDEVTMDEDMISFRGKYQSNKYSRSEKLVFAKELYEKYPNNFELIHYLGDLIVENLDTISDNIKLLKELHQRIMSECTDEEYRRRSIHRMCFVATDDKLEDLIGESELNWQEAIAIGELREERYVLQGRYDEFRRERNATDLLIFMQYLGRHCMNYYGNPDKQIWVENFSEPERTAAWEQHKLSLLEHFDPYCTCENGVPDAWCGCYAEFTLKASGALIACKKLDEGFLLLEKAFSRYERWNKIPAGSWMSVGNEIAFGNATVNKENQNYKTNIRFEDGKIVWSPYLWLFWQTRKDIESAMEQWPWFDNVREDERYLKLIARAKEMAK